MKKSVDNNKDSFLIRLGLRVVSERIERGISQKELAEIMEINPTALRRIEKGKVNTSIYQIKEVCEALEIKICQLFDCDSPEDCDFH